jgi:hypothetical protein
MIISYYICRTVTLRRPAINCVGPYHCRLFIRVSEKLMNRSDTVRYQQYELQMKFESPLRKSITKKPLLVKDVNDFQDNIVKRYANTIDKNVAQ